MTKEFIGKAPESARDYLFEFRLIASDGYKNSSTTDLSVTFKINFFSIGPKFNLNNTIEA